MNLNNTIEIYKKVSEKRNFEEIENIENKILENGEIQFSKIIEIPYKHNFHLEIVMSADKTISITEFLYQALYKLEYQPIEEFPLFNVEDYKFNNMIEELSTVEAKEFLINQISSNNSLSINKLKEKDELTFIIENKSNYIFVSEIYWKS